jgi:ADP-glucose pyrophosphorylase
MKNPNIECKSRGIMILNAENQITSFVEKPPTLSPSIIDSCLACAPLYLFRKNGVDLLNLFLKEKREENAKIESYDAPGFLLQYLCNKIAIKCYETPSRIDIGSLGIL